VQRVVADWPAFRAAAATDARAARDRHAAESYRGHFAEVLPGPLTEEPRTVVLR
jgi:hypothetical protein